MNIVFVTGTCYSKCYAKARCVEFTRMSGFFRK